MSELNNIIDVDVYLSDVGVSKPNFSTMMIVASHDLWDDAVREFNSLTELVDAGVPLGHAIYKAATAWLSPSPNSAPFKVGKRSNQVAQEVKLTPTAADSRKYTVEVTEQDGTLQTIEFTSDATATVAEICTGIVAAAVAASLTDITFTDDTTHVTITNDTDGEYFAVRAYTDAPSDETAPLWTRNEETADAGIAADLTAILGADPDFYYFVPADVQDHAGLVAAAAWATSNKRMMLATSPDEDILGSGSSDVASTIKATTNYYAVLTHSRRPYEYPTGSVTSYMGTIDPGKGSWYFKTVSGPTGQRYTSTQKSNATGKNCNIYAVIAGANRFIDGKTLGGRFIDLQVGIDWFKAEAQTELATLLSAADKIPFTEAGFAQIEAALSAVCGRGERQSFIDSGWTVTMPDLDDVSDADKTARTLTGIMISARVAGAIHTLNVSVYLGV